MTNSTFCIWYPSTAFPGPATPNCHSLSHNTAKLFISILSTLKDNLTGYLCGHSSFCKGFCKNALMFYKKRYSRLVLLRSSYLSTLVSQLWPCLTVNTIYNCRKWMWISCVCLSLWWRKLRSRFHYVVFKSNNSLNIQKDGEMVKFSLSSSIRMMILWLHF